MRSRPGERSTTPPRLIRAEAARVRKSEDEAAAQLQMLMDRGVLQYVDGRSIVLNGRPVRGSFDLALWLVQNRISMERQNRTHNVDSH